MKSILIVAALAIASLSVVSAKSYQIVLNGPTVAGQTTLSPGHYVLKVNGSVAEFHNVDNSKTTTVPVKVETSDKKFEYTAVDTKSSDGVSAIESITLQDTNSKLAF